MANRVAEDGVAENIRGQRTLTGMRALIALVACCGTLLWAARVVWKHKDPVLAEERAILDRSFAAVQSRKASERVEAIREIEGLRLGNNAVPIRPLTVALGDEDDNVRLAAVKALGQIGHRAVQVGLDDDAVRAAATALIGRLKEPEPRMRAAVVNALGAMVFASPEAETRLSPPGGTGGTPVAPGAVARPVDTAAVIAALTEVLRDPNAEVRGAAILALAAATVTEDPPQGFVAVLADASAANRTASVLALSQYRRGLDSWIPTLIRVAERDDDRSVREATLQVLSVSIGPPGVTKAVIPALVEGMGSRDRHVRTAIARIFYRFGPAAEPAIPVLLRSFKELDDDEGADVASDNRALSGAIAEALGRIAPGTASVEAVVTALTEAVSLGQGHCQDQAAWALGQFGKDAAPALPGLIRLARESGSTSALDNTNEQAAAWALGRIAPGTPAADAAFAALVDVLKSDHAPARLAAVEAISLQPFDGDYATIIPSLQALREDPDVEVRRAVEGALFLLGGTGF